MKQHFQFSNIEFIEMFKDEYHANENPLKNSDKIAYVGQRLMYPIIKKIVVFNGKCIAKICLVYPRS